MKDKFIELTDDDGGKVIVVKSNIAWFKGEGSGTMVAFNFLRSKQLSFYPSREGRLYEGKEIVKLIVELFFCSFLLLLIIAVCGLTSGSS